jgi:hypothetical protein
MNETKARYANHLAACRTGSPEKSPYFLCMTTYGGARWTSQFDVDREALAEYAVSIKESA